jgi:hypothetical protein
MRTAVTLGLLCCCVIGYAQPPEVMWTTALSGFESTARDVIETSDHELVMIGYRGNWETGQHTYPRFAKFDLAGNLIWDRTTFGYRATMVHGGVAIDSGGFVYTGYITNPNAPYDKVVLRKVSASGDQVWERFYDSPAWDRGTCITPCDDGGYAIGGNVSGAGMLLIRVSDNGDSLWSRQYSAGGSATCAAIVECRGGGFALAGWYAPENPFYLWLIRTTGDGDTIWTRQVDITGFDLAECIRQTADDGFLLAGRSGDNSGLVIKFDSLGEEQWRRTEPQSWMTDIVLGADGGFIVSGTDSCDWASPATSRDFFAERRDSSGNLIWRETVGGHGEEFCWSVIQTSDSGYALAGMTLSDELPGENGFWMVKLGPDPVPTPPDSFCLTRPAPGVMADSRATFLVWEGTQDPNPNDSVSFCVELATDSSLSAPRSQCSLRADSTRIVWLGADSVWWRVTAHDAYGLERRSCDSRLLIFPPRPEFQLVQPGSRDFLLRTQRFRWTAVPGTIRSDSIRYYLSVAADSAFVEPIVERSIYDTTIVLYFYDPLPVECWYRVIATDRFGNELPSAQTIGLDVHAVGAILPTETQLLGCYPNPFNPSTEIRFELGRREHVRLAVYDLLGREVAVLADAELSAGSYSRTFDGGGFASGVYLYRLQAGDKVQTRKMVMLK